MVFCLNQEQNEAFPFLATFKIIVFSYKMNCCCLSIPHTQRFSAVFDRGHLNYILLTNTITDCVYFWK